MPQLSPQNWIILLFASLILITPLLFTHNTNITNTPNNNTPLLQNNNLIW